MILGDVFLCWISAQPARTATVQKCVRVLKALGERQGSNMIVAKKLLADLARSGHLERVYRPRGCIVATAPTLVVSCPNEHGEGRAEWVGARGQATIRNLASAFRLTLTCELSCEEHTRWFLAGKVSLLREAIKTLGGSLQRDPTKRLLASMPAISLRLLLDGAEHESVPHDEILSRWIPGARTTGFAWRRVNLRDGIPTGLYRVGTRTARFVWHQSGRWRRVEAETRLSAAWLQASSAGVGVASYVRKRRTLSINRIGVPLPVLCDRALRLRCGPPTWSDKTIDYVGAAAEDAAEIARILKLQIRFG